MGQLIPRLFVFPICFGFLHSDFRFPLAPFRLPLPHPLEIFRKIKVLKRHEIDSRSYLSVVTIHGELSAILFESLTTEAIPAILACGEPAAPKQGNNRPGPGRTNSPSGKG